MVATETPTRNDISFTGAGGITLRGDAWGNPEARPVLMLHGGGQTRHSWSGTAKALAIEGWYAVSIDLRGHGDSDWSPDGVYGFQPFVDDTTAVASSFREPPVLVGASLGGISALMAEAESESTLAAGIVLVDVTPRLEKGGVERIMNFMNLKPEGFESLEEAADAIASYRQHRTRPKDIFGLAKNLRKGEDGRYHWHWDPAFIRGDKSVNHSSINQPELMLAAARKLEVPVLLVRGRESDVVSEAGASEFTEAVPHAKFADVSGAGHMVAGDRNDAFSEAVIDFLRSSSFVG